MMSKDEMAEQQQLALSPAGLAALWNRLVEPAEGIRDEELRRRSRLLASVVFVVLPLMVVFGMVVLPKVSGAASFRQSSVYYAALLAYLCSFAALVLNRLGRYRLAAGIYLGAYLAPPVMYVATEGDPHHLAVGTIAIGGVFLAGILFTGFSAAVWSGAGVVAGTLLIPLFSPMTFADLSVLITANTTLASVILVYLYYQNRLEQERSEGFNDSIKYSQERTSQLMEAVIGIASLEFGQMLPVTDRGDVFDALATGLNALGEELIESTVSKAYLEDIFSSIISPLIILDAEKNILSVNPAVLELLGYKEADLIGQPIEKIVKIEELNLFEIESLWEDEAIKNVDIAYRAKDGREIPMSFSGSVLYDERGQVEGYVCAAQDITERVLAEQERIQLVKDLESQNAELERFTYVVSHDLKSPLITIKGFGTMLEKSLADHENERLVEDVGRINHAADTMKELLDELLELSRIGRIVSPFEEVALSAVVQDAVELTSGRIKQAGIKVELSAELPVVHGDHSRLVEVFQNLIDNAAKFMGEQPQPCIEIGVRPEEDLVIFVRDNGIGIDPRYHDKVFRLFERLDNGIDGTGIGLAVVKRIIDIHGGRIWVESEGDGRGSTFCLTISEKEESNERK